MKLSIKSTHLKSALLCKAVNDVRWYLCGVLFAKNGDAVGCNGHIAYVGEHNSEIESDVIISFICQIPSRFGVAELTFNNDEKEGIVKFYDSVFLTKVISSGMVQIVDGKYPDYTKLCTKNKMQTDEIGFNAKYLGLLEKVCKLHNPIYSGVALSLNGDSGCAFADIKNPEQEKALMVIMPMRL